DLVRVSIPKIDQFSIDHSSLLCKILEETELGTSTYPELSVFPPNKNIYSRSRKLQSVGIISSS
ncbi:22925_t:CDS:2, partial [Gigaspora rosea]